MRALLPCLLLLLSDDLAAQWDARSIARAGLEGVSDTVMIIGRGNISSSAIRSGPVIAGSFIPGLFGLAELRRMAAAASLPVEPWGLEVHMKTYGLRLFRLTSVELGIARTISPASACGIQAGATRWDAQGYGSEWWWSAATGILYRDRELSFGSVLRAEYGRTDNVQYAIAAGTTIQLMQHLSVSVEVRQRSKDHAEISYAVRSYLVEHFEVMLGWKDAPPVIGGGCAISWSGLEAIYGANWHAVLGWSQAATIRTTL